MLTMLQEGTMIYMFYGSMGILAWKCGGQLLKEAAMRYRGLPGEEDLKKKRKSSRRFQDIERV